MNRIKSLKDAVQQAIDNGARSAEDVYMRVARMPFEQLERIAAIEGVVKKARGLHDQSIARVYETIRAVNKRVGKLADEALQRLGVVPVPRKHTRTRTRRAKTRARAAA